MAKKLDAKQIESARLKSKSKNSRSETPWDTIVIMRGG